MSFTNNIYTYRGGKAFNPEQPTVLMLHGVLNDHSVWILQSRYLAHHGWNVLAIDLPGHAKSGGEVPISVEAAADAVMAYLAQSGISKVALVGHSFGSLIALDIASKAASGLALQPALAADQSPCGLQVSHLCMIGTAYPMKVGQALLDAARDEPHKAIAMVNTFSHSTLAPPPSTLGPGTWLYGGSAALMRRVLATSQPVQGSNVFHTGFSACNNYAGGEAAIETVASAGISTQFILGQYDQMTMPKNARGLIEKCSHASVDIVPAGHALMSEAPDDVLTAMKVFLSA